MWFDDSNCKAFRFRYRMSWLPCWTPFFSNFKNPLVSQRVMHLLNSKFDEIALDYIMNFTIWYSFLLFPYLEDMCGKNRSAGGRRPWHTPHFHFACSVLGQKRRIRNVMFHQKHR